MEIKKYYFLISVFLVLVTVAAAIHIDNVKYTAVSARYGGPVVIIDAGHGGFDGGAVADDGTIEKDLNLSVALKLEDFVNAFGFTALMVRRTDTATNHSVADASAKSDDMKNRLALMQKYPDSIYISIHQNKYITDAPCGAQIFYSPRADGSERLAESLRSSVIELLQPENRRTIKPGDKNMYLLYNATVPAVIVECGFISNPADLQNLKSEEYQQKIAFAIALGLVEYVK